MSDINKQIFKGKEVNSRKKIIKILKNNAQLSGVINSVKERNEVVNEFKKYKSGGITKEEAREILGKFYYNKRDSLDRNETRHLAQALKIKGVHKYKKSKELIEQYNKRRKEYGEREDHFQKGLSGNIGSAKNSLGSNNGNYSRISHLY
jgi:hypothetical protein